MQKIYTDAKLTKRQIEILEALERTEDNYNNREIYTKADAAKMLNTTESNVRKTFHTIKNKVIKAYGGQVPNKINTRQETIKLLENFLDNIEDEKDVIDFINNNINEEFVLYILYDSDLDSELLRYFNLNKDKDIHTDTMKKFTTYFIKEVYTYIELLKYNDEMSNKQTELKPTYPKKEYEGNKDGEVKRYLRWDKLPEEQMQGEYITIDGELYFFIP